MDPVVHFEMRYDDAARMGRMGRIDRQAFGRQTEPLSADISTDGIATTTEESGPAGPEGHRVSLRQARAR